MEKFDVCVIGCGPAGFAAAMRCLDFGKKVCIIEGNEVGGAGIINGALTSKTMWELSRDYANACSVDRGFRAAGLVVDYDQVRRTVFQAAKEKQYQILSQIETFSPSQSNHGSLTLVRGWAKFKDKKTVVVEQDKKSREIQAGHFVITIGSQPRALPGIEIDQERIIDSEGVLNLKAFPNRMIVIGAGIVGCEFATVFSNFRQTEVHLLDRAPRIIPFEDQDVSDFVSKNMEENGVVIHHSANLRAINKRKDHLEVVIDYKDGHSKVIEVDLAFLSIGRVPSLKKLNLKAIGVKPNDRGILKVDDICRVSDNIFAAGDITGNAALVNVAEMEGRFAAKGIHNEIRYPLNYKNMSTIMFFSPEIAAVGMNEKEAREQKIPYRVAYYSNALVNRTISMRNTRGFVKILVRDDGSDQILGMRAAGPQASSSIMTIALVMDNNETINSIMKTVHPHPSITEGIQDCLRVLMNKSIFKPKAFPEYIRVRAWDCPGAGRSFFFFPKLFLGF